MPNGDDRDATQHRRLSWLARILRIFIVVIVLAVAVFLLARSPGQKPASLAVPAGHSQFAAGATVTVLSEMLRRRYEHELKQAILEDARLMVRTRFLRGPIIGVACTPMERGGVRVSNDTLHFNCLAIQRMHARTLEGARYFGAIDFADGKYTYGGD